MSTTKAKSSSLTLPLGIAGQEPANAEVGSLAYATDTEKVRVKKVSGWADSGGGGSVTSVTTGTPSVVTISNPSGPVVNIDVAVPASGVTSVVAGTGVLVSNPTGPAATVAADFSVVAAASTLSAHIANTSNPHATTAAQVGLGSVTNDAQLKRAAGDFSAFTAKAAPIAADVALIEDSAAAGAKKRITIGSLPFLTAATAGGLGPYMTPPTVAGPEDDEFLSGSADMAVRGWTCRNITDNVIATRVGDIDPWTFPTGLSNTQYRSTISGSYVLLQIPVGKQFYFYKAITPGTSGSVWARFAINGSQSLSDAPAAYVFLNRAAGGVPDQGLGGYVANGIFTSGGGGQTQQAFYQGTVVNAIAGSSSLAPMTLYGMRYYGTKSFRYFSATDGGSTRIISGVTSPPSGPNVSALAFAGFFIVNSVDSTTQTDTLSGLVAVDFFRTKTGDGWIIS